MISSPQRSKCNICFTTSACRACILLGSIKQSAIAVAWPASLHGTDVTLSTSAQLPFFDQFREKKVIVLSFQVSSRLNMGIHEKRSFLFCSWLSLFPDFSTKWIRASANEELVTLWCTTGGNLSLCHPTGIHLTWLRLIVIINWANLLQKVWGMSSHEAKYMSLVSRDATEQRKKLLVK